MLDNLALFKLGGIQLLVFCYCNIIAFESLVEAQVIKIERVNVLQYKLLSE